MLQEVDFFFGEIECGFDAHAQMNQRVAQHMDLARELAGQRATGAARRSFGAGVDQIGDGLGLGQIDLVIEKRALGELTGLGYAQARHARPAGGGICLRAGFQAAREQQLQHHRTAMRLQLEHVFAGIGVRCREVQGQALVDDGLIVGAKR